MWPTLTLSNGVTLKVQQQVKVKVLQDIVVPQVHYGVVTNKKPLTARAGQKVDLRHYPPGQLTLVKETSSGRIRDIKTNPVEGVDYELIPGQQPYPDMSTPVKPLFPWEF